MKSVYWLKIQVIGDVTGSNPKGGRYEEEYVTYEKPYF